MTQGESILAVILLFLILAQAECGEPREKYLRSKDYDDEHKKKELKND